jgi:flotillin
VLIAFYVLIKGMSAFYIKVPPNMAAFFYGARSGKRAVRAATTAEAGTVLPPGTIVVTGGGRIRKPIIESVKFLDLSEITLADLKVADMPNVDGVLVTVEAVANIRFKDDAESLLAAGGRFLDKSAADIERTARETLEANLRGVVGRLTVEEIIMDRDAFRQKVLEEAGEDLARLGMQIDVFNPQSITDSMLYIEALGKKRTAEVHRDARIGEAEAQSEAKKKASDAERAAEVVAQENERQMAEAKKNANVAKQQYEAELATETAGHRSGATKGCRAGSQDRGGRGQIAHSGRRAERAS